MHLVIQGAEVDTRDLKDLAKLTTATAIKRLADTAFCLHGAHVADGIAERCAAAHLDHGFVPENRRLGDFRLLVMDMDSTLITMETIDELADMVGVKTAVAAITAQAMRGEIDYDQSLRQRLSLLRDLDADALERVYDERLAFSPGAERLLATAHEAGIKTLLVSGGFSAITDRLKARLGINYTRANTLEIAGGRLTGNVIGTIVNADEKCAALLRVAAELGVRRDQIAGVGDGANDLKFLAACGVSIAYRAKPVVRNHTSYAINYAGLDGLLYLLDAQCA